MNQTIIIAPITDLSAFCATCPEIQEVTAFLEQLGFGLDFALPAKKYPRKTWQALPILPAQYHYRDGHGTEVIFLAGTDIPCGVEDGRYPNHASRWWIYPGCSECVYEIVAQELRTKWGMMWRSGPETRGCNV